MAKITSFDKANLKDVRVALTAALKQVSDQYGINIDVGNIRFSPAEFTTKLTVTIPTTSSATNPEVKDTKWKTAFLRNAWSFGLSPDDFGKQIEIAGKQYIIAGARPRAVDAIVLQTNTGKFIAYAAHSVVKALGK